VSEALIIHAAFDEAGDTGVGVRASRYLVVAGIACAYLEPLRKAVMRTRKSLGKDIRSLPELKAWHTPPKITVQLLQRLVGLEIEIYTAILDKHSAKQPKEAEDWYRQVYTEAVRQALAHHPYIILTMDKRYTKAALQDQLVQAIVAGAQRPGATLSFVQAESQQERALQAADAIAWSIFQKYEREDDTFYRVIEEKLRGEILLLR
jgi:hypothetical protein